MFACQVSVHKMRTNLRKLNFNVQMSKRNLICLHAIDSYFSVITRDTTQTINPDFGIFRVILTAKNIETTNNVEK